MHLPAPLVWTDIDLVPEARAALAAGGVRLEVHPENSREHLDLALAVIAGSRLRGDAAFFAQAGRVRVIARSGIGCDRIDLEAATAAGVCVVNTPDAPTESTAEFTIALMLAVSRQLCSGARALAHGVWTQGPAVIGSDLAEKTLGLIGCGRIGRRVAEIARALRMRVQAYDPLLPALPSGVEAAADLPQLLASSDFISLHLPATPATRHLIDAPNLRRVKAGAILINTARGLLVDPAAVLEALETGRLAGAALDVWDPEPPPPDLPLLRHPRVMATPHMAALTREGRVRSHVAAAAEVLQVLRDEQPRFILNPDVWARRRVQS